MADATPRPRCALLPSTLEQILPNDFYQDASPLCRTPRDRREAFLSNKSECEEGGEDGARREGGRRVFQSFRNVTDDITPPPPLLPFLACLTTFGRDIISPQRLYSSLSNNDNLQLYRTEGKRPAVGDQQQKSSSFFYWNPSPPLPSPLTTPNKMIFTAPPNPQCHLFLHSASPFPLPGLCCRKERGEFTVDKMIIDSKTLGLPLSSPLFRRANQPRPRWVEALLQRPQ